MTTENGMADINLAAIKTLDGLDVAGKRVLVRADLNVPVEAGAVADATRIERVLPTIDALRKRGARVVLMSHFGRPKGERSPETSLKPVAVKLKELLKQVEAWAKDDYRSVNGQIEWILYKSLKESNRLREDKEL